MEWWSSVIRKIVSLAGVMGAKNSGCDMDTKNVVLESACFSQKALPENRKKTEYPE